MEQAGGVTRRGSHQAISGWFGCHLQLRW